MLEFDIYGTKPEILSAILDGTYKKPHKSLAGSEGVVEFFGTEFITKSIFECDFTDKIFTRYCEEIAQFADAGLAYPKTYSWAIIRNSKSIYAPKHYILQEQIHGKEIYESTESMYDYCTKICTKEEYHQVLNKASENRALFLEIMKKLYDVNSENINNLHSLPKDEFARFAHTIITMLRDCKFSRPDFHHGNVIFDGKHLTMIDNELTGRKIGFYMDADGKINEEKFLTQILVGLLDIFSSPKYFSYKNKSCFDASELKHFEKIDKQNLELLKDIFITVIGETKKLTSPIVITPEFITNLQKHFDDFSKAQEREIINTLEK